MARSGRDATLFTATGPYASSKPSTASTRFSTIDFNEPPPPNETPQEKVARLRALAQRARAAQQSRFDRVVATGRTWADRAHRFTTMSLIIATGCASVFMTFSLVDLLMYNRRKKKEWSVLDKEKKLLELNTAMQAVESRTATQEQAALVAKHQKYQAEAKAKKNRTWSDAILGRPLTVETGTEGTLGLAAGMQDQAAPFAAAEETGRSIVQAVEEKTTELKQAATATHAATSDATRLVGGPLDQMASNAANAASSETKGWLSWIRGR